LPAVVGFDDTPRAGTNAARDKASSVTWCDGQAVITQDVRPIPHVQEAGLSGRRADCGAATSSVR
jgi:hypothetical protein